MQLPEVSEVVSKTTVGALGATYSIYGMPFADAAALATMIYMAISAILLLPKLIQLTTELYQRWFKKDKNESSN